VTDETDLGIEGVSNARLLDTGGFADVYEARDEFGRRVAIKVLKVLDEATRRRFDRERAVMGRVAGHAHIVSPFTSGYTTKDGKPYVVMEYLGGGSLQQRLDRGGPMPVAEAISLIKPIAEALGASHQAGIIHKDVKPANILLTDDGSPKLADFGIAAMRDVTTTTALAYSPAYTPPETFYTDASGDTRDERSDLYSLGATLFALVVGRGPFLTGDESPAAVMARILNEPPPQTGYPDLDRFLAVAMAKEPAYRYQTAAQFGEALQSVAGASEPAVGPPTVGAPPAWPGGASHPTPPAPGPSHPGFAAPPPGWDSPPSGPTRAAWPPAGPPSGAPPTGYEPVDDVQASPENRTPLLVAGGVLTALVLTAVALTAITLLRSDGDTDLATGEDLDAETVSTPEPTQAAEATETTRESTTTIQTATTEYLPSVPADLGDYGDLSGTSVTITGIEGGDLHLAGIEGALEVLSSETGIEVTYTRAFQDDLEAMVAAGSPPDITMFAQPIELAGYAHGGNLVAVPSEVTSSVSRVWNGEWTGLGEVDGVQYGVPNGSNLKSLVWYKPARFEELGYEVPQSWNDLLALTEQAIADGNTPWCVGIESGAATGWVFTDWVEDILLRRHGPEVYDQWVAGEVRFSDPPVADTFQEVLDLWTLPGSVHTGSGSIVNTAFQDAAEPLVNNDCLMHRQGSFFSNFLPGGTPFADGSADAVDVFYLPSHDENRPVVGSGSWAAAFADRPEVWVVMHYLGSTEYANNRQAAQAAEAGDGSPTGFLTAVDDVNRNLFSPLENSMLDILAVAGPVRYDASDAMPAAVGADTFWSEGAALVNGDTDLTQAVAAIDASWPR
jgi:alpha-glucoside transport system substrate-binding protein